jgi:hypothetical protein
MVRHFGRSRRRAVHVAAALAMSGCAAEAKTSESAEATVRAFARALGDGKLSDAYALMSSDYRSRVSLSAWQKSIAENPQEVVEISGALSHVTGPAQLRGELRYADGRSLQLQEEAGHFRLKGEVLAFYDQSSPRATLRAFLAAMARRRYDVVLRLMPEADKEGVTIESMEVAYGHAARGEVERMLAELRAHVDDPLEIVGDRATMPYAEHRRVQFLLEDGRWKIEDPE